MMRRDFGPFDPQFRPLLPGESFFDPCDIAEACGCLGGSSATTTPGPGPGTTTQPTQTLSKASYVPIVSTIRNRASPLIMRSYASAARSSGIVSFIDRTPVWTLNASVSCESIESPEYQP